MENPATMTDHSPISACPDCGTPLPPDSPQALCPACLMRQALASRTIVDGDPRANPPFSPEEIAGKFPGFEILECLGRGGMGVVYKARQKSLNRIIAIKILAPERGGETRFAERFAREAEFLAKLNHPHIVTIHDFGETAGLFYLVMEFVDGVNLRDLIRDGKLEAKQALAIVPPICDALQYAHDKGIVHRDIKPENLLLDREGRIKIADFGIAALMGTDVAPSGTPPYMAPEQCGASPEVDSRADIYALGVVLYEMLTGERPNKELIAPSKKVHIDVRLDEIVLRALEKTPELRYQTAGEFRTQVETIASTSANFGAKEAQIHASEIDNHSSDVYSRFSRTAIVGGCWALAAVLHYLMPTLGYRMKSEFVPIMMSILGLSAPIGTTILGWIAVRQIRRSAGKLRGMRLAVFDGLFFPLLLLVVAVGFTFGLLISELEMGSPKTVQVYALALLVCSPLCWFITRCVWRKVNKPVAGPHNSEQSKSATGSTPASETKPTPLGKWAVGFFIGAIVGSPLLGGFMGLQEIIVLCGLALLLSLVFGVMSWRSKPGKFAALASGLGLLLWAGFTFNYLAPRLPHGENAPRVSNRFDPDPPTRVEVIYSHPNSITTASQQITVPVHPTTNGRFQPPNGQAMPLARGSNILVRACAIKDTDGIIGVVESSLDGKLWERQEAALTPNVSVDLRFDNGLLVELVPGYLVGSVNEAIEANKRSAPPVMLPAASSDARAFGPVMERELRVDEETLAQGLNFESGKVLTLSLEEFNRKGDDGTERMPYRSFGDWVEANGIGMYAAAGDKGFGLAGSITEFKLSALPVAAWDTATEPELKEALEHAVMEHAKFSSALLIPADAALPLTYALRSGDKLGLLQITALVQNPNGIKMRYKLLQPAPPVKPAPKKQYEVSIQFGQNPNDPVVKTDLELGTQFNNFKKAGDRLFSISGQIDEPKNGKFPGSITLGDYNVSEAHKGTGHQGTIPVELELGKPFNHTVVVGIGFIRIITLSEKPASSEPIVDPAATDSSDVDGARGEHFEPMKKLEIPLQDFPEGGGREGCRLTVAPGTGDYVLATLREYEGAEVIGEKTPVKRQVARLLRTQSASHSEDIFLDVYGDDVKTRIAAGSRYGVSGFGQQVVITGLGFGGGSGNSVGGEKQPRFVTRRFKFIDPGGDKARTRIVEFELRMISEDDAMALAKRRGFSLPDENVANWAITLSAEPAKEGEKAGP
jgi:predicted Ser/Thr protein kinase